MIRSYGMSHVGRVRSNNEDAYATRPELNLFVVADGMGGAQAGERASQLTVQTLVDQVSQAGDEAGLAALVRGVEKANSNVRWEASQHPELAGMGTTLVAVIVRRPKAFIVNVGDSRAYLQGRGGLEQVTTDHSWVNEVGKSLGLTDEQLKVHPYRNVLTKAVGAEDEVQVEGFELDLQPDDVLLLCSDGLHGVTGDGPLVDIMGGAGSLQEKCQALIDATLECGAPDNVTAVLVENKAENTPSSDASLDETADD